VDPIGDHHVTIRETANRFAPFSEEAELGVLGAFIQNPTEVATLCNEAGVTAEYFYVPANRLIFIALQTICEKAGSDRVDVLSLSMELRRKGAMEMVGGEQHLSQTFEISTVSHAPYYIEELRKHWVLRSVINNARLQESRAYDHEMEADELLATVVSDAVALTTSAKPIISPAQIHAENMAVCDRAKQHGSAGYRSRWDELENVLGSYIPPELIVVAARPSDGKTTFALNEVEYQSQVNGVPCGVVSIEMTEHALRSRLAGSMAEVNTFRGIRGQWTLDDRQQMVEAYARLEKLPIYINDGIRTFQEAQSWCINIHARYGVRFFVVDFLQLMRETGSERYRTRNEFIGSLSSGFKHLAKRLDSVFMVLSQESRGMHKDKSTTPPIPTLESLRDSGEIEQNADKVIIISKRPGLDLHANFRLDQDWPMYVDLAKSRNGPIGGIDMEFLRSLQRLVDQREYGRICAARQPFPDG
jgi:replicative DNA helicase